MHEWLAAYGVPEILVATKADQVPRGRRRAAAARIAAVLGLPEREAPVFVSVRSGEGRDELWSRIDQALRST
jgi:GTP-binding protein EngB required for normal cell division